MVPAQRMKCKARDNGQNNDLLCSELQDTGKWLPFSKGFERLVVSLHSFTVLLIMVLKNVYACICVCICVI